MFFGGLETAMPLADMSRDGGENRTSGIKVKCLDFTTPSLFQSTLIESNLLLFFHKEILSTPPMGTITIFELLLPLPFYVTQLMFILGSLIVSH